MKRNNVIFHQNNLFIKNKNSNDKQDNNKALINRILTSIVLVSFIVLFLFIGASSLNLFGFNNFNIHEQLGFGWAYLFIGMFVLIAIIHENFNVMYKNKKQLWYFSIYIISAIVLSYGPVFLFYFDYMNYYHLAFHILARDFGYIELAGFFLGGFLLFICEWINLKQFSKSQIVLHNLIHFLICYFFMFFNFIMLLHTWTAIFIIWIPVICNDSFAYLIGRKIGKHKMAKIISPKKTWEGAAAGIISGMIFILIIGGFYQIDQSKEINNFNIVIINNNIQGNLFGVTLLNLTSYKHIWVYFLMLLLFGFIIGWISIAGDLFFSFFKRKNKIKDYANYLPGHGGILDRIDSFIFTIIFFGLYQVISFAINPEVAPLFPFINN